MVEPADIPEDWDSYTLIVCHNCGHEIRHPSYEVAEFRFAEHLKVKHGITFPDLPDFGEK